MRVAKASGGVGDGLKRKVQGRPKKEKGPKKNKMAPGGGGISLYPFPLYPSAAADDQPCVDLGGRRIIKKKK